MDENRRSNVFQDIVEMNFQLSGLIMHFSKVYRITDAKEYYVKRVLKEKIDDLEWHKRQIHDLDKYARDGDWTDNAVVRKRCNAVASLGHKFACKQLGYTSVGALRKYICRHQGEFLQHAPKHLLVALYLPLGEVDRLRLWMESFIEPAPYIPKHSEWFNVFVQRMAEVPECCIVPRRERIHKKYQDWLRKRDALWLLIPNGNGREELEAKQLMQNKFYG